MNLNVIIFGSLGNEGVAIHASLTAELCIVDAFVHKSSGSGPSLLFLCGPLLWFGE